MTDGLMNQQTKDRPEHFLEIRSNRANTVEESSILREGNVYLSMYYHLPSWHCYAEGRNHENIVYRCTIICLFEIVTPRGKQENIVYRCTIICLFEIVTPRGEIKRKLTYN